MPGSETCGLELLECSKWYKPSQMPELPVHPTAPDCPTSPSGQLSSNQRDSHGRFRLWSVAIILIWVRGSR